MKADTISETRGYLDADAFDVGSMPGSATTASSAISLEAWFKADGFDALNRIITRSVNSYSSNLRNIGAFLQKV